MARIGIDLGTTNTLVGFVYDDGAHVVPRRNGRVIPSAVHFRGQGGDDDVVVGEEAFNAGRGTVRSVKRLMGRTYATAIEEGSVKYFPPDHGSVRLARRGDTDLALEVIQEGGRHQHLWPHEVSALILAEARRHAESHLGRKVQASVTVPAYFRDPHRAATLDAARAAGLEIAGDLLDEPTAAALAFAPVVGFRPGEPVLVVDWGGGTLDVTVLASHGHEWFQAAISGDLTLGGDDLDLEIAQLALARAGLPLQVLADEANRWALISQARIVKETLSERADASFICSRLVHGETGARLPPVAVTFTRDAVDHRLASTFDRALGVVEACLANPNVDRPAIRKVLLVGGSSRIPAFRARLAALLPGARLHDEVDPMHAVALGAALYANARPDIARICPYGYAVITEDGTRTDVIPPDTEVPTAQRFAVPTRTRYADQTVYRMSLVSYTAHRNGLRTWHEPRRLFARGMPRSPAATRVDVELWLDQNKDLQARSHVEGHREPYPLQGREEGPEELFTRVLDATLDAEAIAEANPADEKGVVQGLLEALEWARVVERRRDREDALALLTRLRDLHDQVQASHRFAERQALDPDERLRRGVLGWVWFWEDDFIPRFSDVLEEATRVELLTILKGIRVKLETGAGGSELGAKLTQLQKTAFTGELTPAYNAVYRASLMGVPERLSTALVEHALRARDHHLAGDRRALALELEALQPLLAESEDAVQRWVATGTLRDAIPDLEVIDTSSDRVH